MKLFNENDSGVQALILCPTRELCIQTGKEFSIFSKYIDKLKTLAVYGRANIHPQIKALKQGVQIVTGTPGRILDLIKCFVLAEFNQFLDYYEGAEDKSELLILTGR